MAKNTAKKTPESVEERIENMFAEVEAASEKVAEAAGDAQKTAEAAEKAVKNAKKAGKAAAEKAVDTAAEKTLEPAAEKPAEPAEPEPAKKPGKKKKARKEKTKMSKKALHQELEDRRKKLEHTKEELSDKMKAMLSKELKDKDKKEKRRAAEILGVFSAHNFYANGFTPVELRTTLEDLGPTYVKIGQIMSSRVDLLPESYCKELEKLRQNVKELDPQIARAVIEQETGKKIDEIYSEFRDKPLGSASIGQVHYAVLKDGTKVVTKVQRPLIAEMMRNDYVLLKKGAAIVNAVGEADDSGEEKLDLLSVIEEMEKVTEEELDFRVEAENTRFFKEHCITDETKITCPTVYDELTTERIFTMSYVDGCSIGKKDKLLEQGCDLNELGETILDNYMHQILDVGTFHADPHQGNIMVANKIPYWIDFGMMGKITEADINTLQQLILSLVEGDMDALVNAVMGLGAASPKTNRNKLLEDVDVMFEKYMNVTSLEDIDLSALLEEIVDLATRHHITLPGKFTMLVRSIATIEGVMEQLCPDLNLFEIISQKMMERAQKSFDMKQELLSVGKEALEIGKKSAKLPVLAADALNSMVKGRTKINMELTGYEELLNRTEVTVENITLAVFACILFIGSCILTTADISPKTPQGVPLVSALGFVLSIALGIFTFRKMIKDRKRK